MSAIALLGCAVAALGFGVLLPIVELKRFFLFEDGYSIVSMVRTLAAGGEWLLAMIVAAFAIVLPLVKIAALGLMATSGGNRCPTALALWLERVGRWAMLDVLIVAILIFTVKVSGVHKAATQPGLYFFVLSVVLVLLAGRLVAQAPKP